MLARAVPLAMVNSTFLLTLPRENDLPVWESLWSSSGCRNGFRCVVIGTSEMDEITGSPSMLEAFFILVYVCPSVAMMVMGVKKFVQEVRATQNGGIRKAIDAGFYGAMIAWCLSHIP